MTRDDPHLTAARFMSHRAQLLSRTQSGCRFGNHPHYAPTAEGIIQACKDWRLPCGLHPVHGVVVDDKTTTGIVKVQALMDPLFLEAACCAPDKAALELREHLQRCVAPLGTMVDVLPVLSIKQLLGTIYVSDGEEICLCDICPSRDSCSNEE